MGDRLAASLHYQSQSYSQAVVKRAESQGNVDLAQIYSSLLVIVRDIFSSRGLCASRLFEAASRGTGLGLFARLQAAFRNPYFCITRNS